MANNPPDDLESIIQANSGGVGSNPLSRRQIIPYDDLQALNTPGALNSLSNDVVTTLAILAAQGPKAPRLLSCDDQGRARVQAANASITQLTAPLAALATTATVKDSSAFYVGQAVTLAANDGTGNTCSPVFIKRIPDGNTIQFLATCSSFGFNIGDFVVGGGDVRVTNVVSPVNIGSIITMIPPGGPNPGDQSIGSVSTIAGHKRLMVDKERSCDAIGIAVDVQPGAATVVLPAVAAGVANVIKWATFSGNNLTGAAQSFNIEIWDGPVGTGTRKWRGTISFPIAALVTLHITDLHIRGTGNTQMTVAFNAGAANMFQDITAGAYFEGV